MTPIIIALTFAVTATLYWAAKPLSPNHAEQDEATYEEETK